MNTLSRSWIDSNPWRSVFWYYFNLLAIIMTDCFYDQENSGGKYALAKRTT